MRLADFINANVEPILADWESFARSIWCDEIPSSVILRDSAEAILRAAAADMRTGQTGAEQLAKSRGRRRAGSSAALEQASREHATARVRSGFDLVRLVSEYRALRASVVRLWCEDGAATDPEALTDLTRFHETMDESLAEGIRSFSLRLDHSRDIFLGILGHDLRGPLNAMTLLAQALAESTSGDQPQMAQQIMASGEAAARILGDFIDFTSARLGRGIPIAPQPVDFAAVAREVANEARVAGAGGRLQLVARGDTMGNWDRIRLRQVVGNLVGNAIQHGCDDKPIYVELAGEADGVTLRVRNAGEPIPAETLARMFEPLACRPVECNRARRAGSIGLGLYIAREIIRAHGGTIRVKSTATEGTEFTVSLPRSHTLAAETAASAAAGQPA